MQKVLLTGASGFIGRHFAEELTRRQVEVWCLVRRSSRRERLESLGCKFVEGDVASLESLRSSLREAAPDTVFHLAGITKAINPQDLYEVNQTGTRNLGTVCSELDAPPTFVLVSTLAAAGASGELPRTESDRPTPVSHYGRSKLAAEQEAMLLADSLPISVVRPPIVFGPHDRDTFEMFKSIATVGLHPVPKSSKVRISWIQVSDLCRALIAVAEQGKRLTPVDSKSTGADAVSTDGETDLPSQGVYFATSDEIVRYGDMGRQIAKVLGNKFFLALPTMMPAIWGLAGVYEGIARITGEQRILNFDKAREAGAGSWICNGEKLKRETGFDCQMNLDETLRSSAAWYREAGWI